MKESEIFKKKLENGERAMAVIAGNGTSLWKVSLLLILILTHRTATWIFIGTKTVKTKTIQLFILILLQGKPWF